MKKNYDINTMTDMPLDASFPAPINAIKPKTTTSVAKPKISAIGKKANGVASTSKTSTAKPATAKTSVTKQPAQTSAEKTTQRQPKKVKELIEEEKKVVSGAKTSKKASDLEKLNEESIRSYRSNSTRNKILIVLLIFGLIISITVITVFAFVSKIETNCFLYAHGVDASFIINGEELEKFKTPSIFRGDSVFEVNIDIKIKGSGLYNVKFAPTCYQNGEELENTLVYGANFELFREDVDGYYYSISPISGGQTIRLCRGFAIDRRYANSLNSDNFKLEFNAYFEAV